MTQGVTFTPTPEQRNQVEVLAGFGLPQHQIAVLLGCDPKTLRKYFEMELSVGDAKATAKIAQTLYNKAVGGDTASLIFWLKARAGWREKHDVEVTGKDGQPLAPMVVTYCWAGQAEVATVASTEVVIEHDGDAPHHQREIGFTEARLGPAPDKNVVSSGVEGDSR